MDPHEATTQIPPCDPPADGLEVAARQEWRRQRELEVRHAISLLPGPGEDAHHAFEVARALAAHLACSEALGPLESGWEATVRVEDGAARVEVRRAVG